MEQWSILSNVVNYVQYNRHPKDFCDLNHKKIYDRFKMKKDRF